MVDARMCLGDMTTMILDLLRNDNGNISSVTIMNRVIERATLARVEMYVNRTVNVTEA